jgi:hypothetical protein
MSVNALSLASGVDLLDLYSQSAGQAAPATPATATAAVLKHAIAQAQLSEAELISSTDSAGQLNVYA